MAQLAGLWPGRLHRAETARNPLSLFSMSLDRLLSFVPFARRWVPPMRDLEREAPSPVSVVRRSLNLLAAGWGLILSLSVAALVVFAWFTPKVAFFSSAGARDAEIHSINSVTDIGLLQRKAVLDVSQGYTTGATATFLCQIAFGAFLLLILGSIGGLLLIRWTKRYLRSAEAEDE